MSEQQVLPPTERIERTVKCDVCGWYTPGVPQSEPWALHETISELRASLAQSEAERERLQGERKELQRILGHNPASARAFLATAQNVITELAREREANQELRGRIKSAVEKLDDWNGDSRGFSASAAVTEAISLLKPKSKPVATTS